MKRSSSQRPGFSLVELMIAIMILGLGMVMVATVFPVSLDMTRNTLQMNISDAAFDAAVSTLRLKVPSQFENLEPGSRGAAPGPAEIVLWPDV
ncbi:MAG TPA: type II secretion system protein, partial [Phycisphaerae bacterium]|nr:type II secretion system protein [Phycisphaerae bacterium]